MLPQAGDDLALRLMDLYSQRDPLLAHALGEGIATGKIATGLDVGPRGGPGDPEGMKHLAAGAAKLLAQPDGPRVAALAFEGWDTHAQEIGRLARLLSGLDGAFAAFEQELGPFVEGYRHPRRHGIRQDGSRQWHGRHRSRHRHDGFPGRRRRQGGPGDRRLARPQGGAAPTTGVTLRRRPICAPSRKGVAVDLLGASPALLARDVFPGSDKIAPAKGLIA